MNQDRQLQEAVLAEFLWEPSVNASHIGVTADQGIISLTGHVSSYFEKQAAEKAAARVKGVKAVTQEIEVRLPSEAERSDENIARAALDRIAWEALVPAADIKVKIEDGWITLSGEVEWRYQHDYTENVIRGLRGVMGITNNLTIKPRVNVPNIVRDIGTALKRSWFEPSTIRVSADRGKVTLTGTVESLSDKWMAATTAWGSPGTMGVENNLVVIA